MVKRSIRALFSVLAVLSLGVVVNAQTVVRTNGGTETATGTDVSLVQKAADFASGDVINVSGTSPTNIAPFTSSVRVESSSNYTVDNFTVQSATGDKQYIGALSNARNYVLKLTDTNYNLTFKDVEFYYNKNAQNTFGIFLTMNVDRSTVTLNLDNASFTKFNASGSNAGGVIYSTGDLTINGSNDVSFTENNSNSGGVIYGSTNITIDCNNITFDSNKSTATGGVIQLGKTLKIIGSTVEFSNNSATTEGGAVYSYGGIDIEADTINFSSNTAKTYGGALRLNNSGGKILIKGGTVTFDSNSALNQNGGAIHTNGNVELKGTSETPVFTFSNNSAPNGNAGVIVAVGSIAISDGSFLFQNNRAKGNGGAIEDRKAITFSGDNTSATFTGNIAGESGSDIYLSNNSTLTFKDGGTYYFDGGIFLVNTGAKTDIDKAQVTIAGRQYKPRAKDDDPLEEDTTNNYQLQTVTISNGGKLTANLDYINSLTGTFTVGSAESAGTLEFNVGPGVSKELAPSDTFNFTIADKGAFVKSGDGELKLVGDFTHTGKTTISGGTLEIPNDFTTSSVLAGSGTLKLSGAGAKFDIGDASAFTGTVQVFDDNISANSRINLAGVASTDIDLSNATVELNGSASGKYSELAFLKGGSTLKIGTLNGNKSGRILTIDSSNNAAYVDLTVSSGSFAGEIGRNDASGSTYGYVNKINLNKVGDGTFTFSGMPYYFGETNIEAGVLKFVNDNESGNKNFDRSSALKGSGTLQVVGNTDNWVFFALDADAGSAQEFTGLMDASGYMVFNKNTNLGKATLHVGENSIVSMNGGNTSALTVKELNTEAGSRVRISHTSPGNGNTVTLTVGSGTVNGDLGETANNTWYNWVNLNKVSDGSDDGGTLTLAGAFLYTGETTVSDGTLKLTDKAISVNGKTTVEDYGTLEFNVAENPPKKLALSAQNAITSTGEVIKTGAGTLQFDAAENSIDAKTLVLSAGRLDFKGFMKGSIIVNNGVFSPGNSVGTATVTGNVVITEDGKALFEFSSFNERLFDVVKIVNGDGAADNGFSAGDYAIQLLFENDDAADWAAALEDNPDGYQLVSDEGFTTLGNLSSWLDNYTNLFGLEGREGGLYLVARGPEPEPGSGVPEPSTWALLALGVAGLLYLRKRK